MMVNASRAQLRVLHRIRAGERTGERVLCATHRNATYQALLRKELVVPSERGKRAHFVLTPLAGRLMAAKGRLFVGYGAR